MSNLRKGDWICSNCHYHCFAGKTQCYKCGHIKQHENLLGDWIGRAGDWQCSCSEINFASRTECRKCHLPNPSSSASSSVSASVSAGVSSSVSASVSSSVNSSVSSNMGQPQIVQ